MKNTLLVILISVALAVPCLAADSAGATKVSFETVGDFALKLAAIRGRSAATPEAAAASLRAAGVNLTVDLSAKLTEGTAARILSDLGVRVANPATPGNELTVERSSQLISTVGRNALLGTEGGPPPGPPPSDLPIQCLVAKNHGTCQECCKIETGCGDVTEDPTTGDPLPGPQPAFACNVCAKFCKSFQPPDPSDPAPQP